MNITSITGYTPNRQAQKVNFGEIKVTPLIKKYCSLSDHDILELNKKCPKGVDISIEDFPDHYDNYRLAYTKVSVEGKEKSTADDVFQVCLNSWAKEINKGNFMDSVKTTLKRYE